MVSERSPSKIESEAKDKHHRKKRYKRQALKIYNHLTLSDPHQGRINRPPLSPTKSKSKSESSGHSFKARYLANKTSSDCT
jgi:hypothetical protein